MSDAPAGKAKKPVMPPSRIAVIVFAVVAAIVVFLELRARYAWDNTYKGVAAAMDDAKEGIYLDDIKKKELIKGSPSVEDDKDKDTVLYTWSGVLKKYRMRLRYGPGGFVENIDQE